MFRFFRKEEAKMTSTFIIVSVLEVAAVALIITGFVFEKKLINFEEKFETALAKKIAHFLCTNKYTKAHFVKEKKTAQRRSAGYNLLRLDCITIYAKSQRKNHNKLKKARNKISMQNDKKFFKTVVFCSIPGDLPGG